MSARTCGICGAERPSGRTRYCSDECLGVAVNEREKARRARRLAACQRCQGPKEVGTRGGKYCDSCREAIADASAQHERERSRRRKQRERESAGLEPIAPVYRDGERRCARCKEYRPVGTFPARKDTNKTASYCRPCQKAYNMERRLKLMFGMTWDEYDFLLMSQDYRCAICNGRPRKHALAVDHDHTTGEIRGLLCSRCNHRLLGSANDDPARLRKAADYLESFMPRDVFGERKYVPGSKRGDVA